MKRPMKGSIEYRTLGPEPLEYTSKTLNWYTYFADTKDFKSWFDEYLKSKKLKLSYDRVPSYIGVMCHFINSGKSLPEESMNKLNSFVESLAPAVPKPLAPNRKGIQELINDQVTNYCSILDGEIDAFIDNKYTSNFDLEKFTSNIKSVQAKRVRDFYIRQLGDVLIQDDISKEGYSYMTKAEKTKYINFMNSIIDSLNKRMMIVKSEPKKQTKKKKAKLKTKKNKIGISLLDSSKEYNTIGKKIENILESRLAILFNTKTKVLSYIVSDSKFDITGSTLKNINEEKSFKITLRKPLDILPKMSKSEAIINKTIKTLTTKKQNISSRLSKDMVLLKTV